MARKVLFPHTRAARRVLGLVLLAAGLWLAGCSRTPQPDPDVIAEVNGTPITVAEFTAAMHRIDQSGARAGRVPKLDRALKIAVLRDLIDRRLVALRAKELGLTVSVQELNLAIAEVQKDYSAESFRDMIIRQYIDLEAWKKEIEFRLLLQKVFQVDAKQSTEPTEAQIAAYYEKNKARYATPSSIMALHVFLPDQATADKLRRLVVGGTDLAEALRRLDVNPEHANHSRPTRLSRGQMPPEFDKLVSGLKIGQWSPPLKSPYGFHLIKVIRRVEARTVPLSEVRRSIVGQLRLELRDRSFARWMEELRRKARIKVNRAFLGPKEVDNIPTTPRSKT